MFSASIGGYTGNSYAVEWKDGQLSYKAFSSCYKPKRAKSKESYPVPSKADWQEFWAELDRIGIWEWKARYDASSIVDGTSWSLETQYNGRQLKTGGSNEYPGQTNEGGYSPEFRAFLKAVQKLLRNKEFN
ncbi:MAG: hypothetical protein ACXAB2_13535 [Candidatus Hodarchaeales archaeon]